MQRRRRARRHHLQSRRAAGHTHTATRIHPPGVMQPALPSRALPFAIAQHRNRIPVLFFRSAVTEGVAIVVVQMVTQHVGDCKIITVACAAANARHFIKNEMETKKAACLNACASCHVCASARVDAVARWPTALFICNKRRRTSRRRSTYSPQS